MPRPKRKSSTTKWKFSEKRFIAVARKHLAEDFPNPARQGCPDDDVLKQAAEQPLEMNDEVFEHISLCSPCYNAFGTFLRKTKTRGPGSKPVTRLPKGPRL